MLKQGGAYEKIAAHVFRKNHSKIGGNQRLHCNYKGFQGSSQFGMKAGGPQHSR
jgi:hypothetical protein